MQKRLSVIALIALMGLIAGVIHGQATTPEPTPALFAQDCQRVSYEQTFNYIIPNLHTVFEIDLESEGEPRLYAFSTSFLLEPHWSPNAARLLFSGTIDGEHGLYTIDFGETGDRSATLIYAGDGEGARWSPDGTRIAFLAGYSTNNGSTDVYLMDADGGNVTRLTESQAFDFALDWSPDGTKIVHQEEGDSVRLVITTLDDNGTALTQPVFPEGSYADTASGQWSPDGSKLLFTVLETPESSARLAVLDVASGEVTFLTAEADGRARSGGVWSPDGTRIAFVLDQDRVGDIFLVKADGGDLTNLTAFPAAYSQPTWSANGDWIAFSRLTFNGVPPEPDGVYVIRPDGSESRYVGAGRSPVWRPCDLVEERPFPLGG
jgi:TolB protein